MKSVHGPARIHACSARLFEKYMKLKTSLQENIELAQICIKTTIGVGDPIRVNFYAPLNEDRPGDEIDYSHEELGKDLDLLLKEQDSKELL